jgi:hypothetical protein
MRRVYRFVGLAVIGTSLAACGIDNHARLLSPAEWHDAMKDKAIILVGTAIEPSAAPPRGFHISSSGPIHPWGICAATVNSFGISFDRIDPAPKYYVFAGDPGTYSLTVDRLLPTASTKDLSSGAFDAPGGQITYVGEFVLAKNQATKVIPPKQANWGDFNIEFRRDLRTATAFVEENLSSKQPIVPAQMAEHGGGGIPMVACAP